MRRRLVIASSVVVLALLVAFFARERNGARPSTPRAEVEHEVATPAVAQPDARHEPSVPLRAPVAAGPRAVVEPPATDFTRMPALRSAFERESPDATAHQDEARLRGIYAVERDADTILRDVRCTRSVCKLDLRWSPELNKPYNDALVAAIKAFGRDIDLTPDVTLGGPEMPIPMTLFIARPGYSVESLLAEQAAVSPRR